MPFQRPTLTEIVERTSADLATRMGLGPLLPRGPLSVIGRVLAGASHLLHGHLDWISRQVLPDTAEDAELERHASIYGITRKPAAVAIGTANFRGNAGVVVPDGTRLRRADGVEFVTVGDHTIAGGSAVIDVAASVGGLEGNSPGGTQLTVVLPISGLASPGSVTSRGISGGTDEESDEDLRARLLARIKQPPAGGNAADYVAWATEVNGVTRAWSYPESMGVGTVGVSFVTDDDPGGAIPNSTKVAEVLAYIQARRPVTARVFVFAPIPLDLDLEVQLSPDTNELRAAVEESVRDLILREAEPGGVVLLSHLREAITSTPGVVDNVLVTPAADVEAGPGELVELGTITWS